MSAVIDLGSDSEPSQIFHYARSVHHMMRKIGYNLQHGNSLNLGRGRRGLLRAFVLKGKPINYYYKIRRGLGYVTPPVPSQSEEEESLPSYFSISSEWESDVSVGVLFKNLSVNMTSINQLDYAEAIEIFETEPWAQQLDLQFGEAI